MADETLDEPMDVGIKDEASPPAAEAEAKEQNEAQGKTKKKRGRSKKESGDVKKEGEEGEKRTPVKKKKTTVVARSPVERPSRERKTVERFVSLTPPKERKVWTIPQGPGTKLKDIPNVVFKMNKRKVDDNLQQLHTVLFSKRAKANLVKRNILQFSGFVWTDNKEKQRTKVQEKLEKYTKDRLLDFFETLDIPVMKASTKKEDLLVKLLEFLESPHVTRDVLLADKVQSSKKRKRSKRVGKEAESHEKRKRGPKSSAKEDDIDKGGEDEVKDGSDDEGSDEDDLQQEGDADKSDSEESTEFQEKSGDEEDTPEVPVGKKASEAKGSKTAKASSTKSEKKEKTEEDKPEIAAGKKKNSVIKKDTEAKDSKAKPKKATEAKSSKVSSTKEDIDGKKSVQKGKKPVKDSVEENDTKIPAKKGASAASSKVEKNKKQGKEASSKVNKKEKEASTSVAKTKEKGKGKSSGKAVAQPTREKMHAVVSDILKEVDFNTATLADILRQLESHFSVDLMDRKTEVKSIIEDVINSMSDVEVEDEEGDAEEKEKSDDGSEGGDSDA